MIRQALAERGHADPHFRHRSHEVSRIEGLTDGVFAFAVTLLVASLEVPHTYAELMRAMRGFFAFAICFAILFQVWFMHYRFFRRYGLQDRTTHVLTAVLLFVVLFYVYPLKFLFGTLFDQIFGYQAPHIDLTQAIHLLVIYGVGYSAVFVVFTALYLHVLRQREALELDAVELLVTREVLWGNVLSVVVGAISITIALCGRPDLAGWTYLLLGVMHTANGTYFGRQIARHPLATVNAR